MSEEKLMIYLAEAKLTGYAHAKQGGSIESLAEEMGLTPEEWDILRDGNLLNELDKETLDEKFNI